MAVDAKINLSNESSRLLPGQNTKGFCHSVPWIRLMTKAPKLNIYIYFNPPTKKPYNYYFLIMLIFTKSSEFIFRSYNVTKYCTTFWAIKLKMHKNIMKPGRNAGLGGCLVNGKLPHIIRERFSFLLISQVLVNQPT